MKGRLLLIAALAVVLTFGFAVSGLQAKESISAYMGYSREVNEGIAKNVEENLGIEIKHITLSWGECWARVQTEKPNFNADMLTRRSSERNRGFMTALWRLRGQT
jgi:ABC-type glycerol-3-phosphate transport system substrate-binding protein